jgi:hypothetical protein
LIYNALFVLKGIDANQWNADRDPISRRQVGECR